MVPKLPRSAEPAKGAPVAAGGITPLDQLPDRGRVLCQGHIESVTFVPADRTAEFSAIVSEDDAGYRPAGAGRTRPPRLRIVWLGRRRVPGIEAGAQIRVEGMLARGKDMPTIFNPRYEILSRQEHE